MEGTGLLGVNDMPLCSQITRQNAFSLSTPLLTVQVGVVSELHMRG